MPKSGVSISIGPRTSSFAATAAKRSGPIRGLAYLSRSHTPSVANNASGLETGEQERIDAFLKAEALPDPVDCESEASFCHSCDAPGELAGDMLLFRFPIAP